MFLLDKLFQIRNDHNPGEEKPFLDHLEDLRSTIFRIVITLVIGFALCFGFKDTLMEVIRAPISNVWKLKLDTSLHKLPVEVKAETWERAAQAASFSNQFTPPQRAHYFKQLSGGEEEFPFHAESVSYYRAAIAIDDKKARETFIKELPEVSEQMKKQLTELVNRFGDGNGPDARADGKQRTVLMQSLKPTEGFMLSFKLALFAGIIVTFPFLLFYILQFVLPGLHKKEKKALFPALFIGFFLFLTGVLFSYFIVLPRVLEFFSGYSSSMGIINDWRIGDYISFALQFTLIFGLAFELPVIVMALVYIGILEYKTMASSRSYAVLAIFIIAALITPTPDALTLILLAGPMYFLYEICIWMSWFVQRKNAKIEAEQEVEKQQRLDQLVKEVEAEEKERHERMKTEGLVAPAHLLSYGDDEVEEQEEDLDPSSDEYWAEQDRLHDEEGRLLEDLKDLEDTGNEEDYDQLLKDEHPEFRDEEEEEAEDSAEDDADSEDKPSPKA